MSQRMRFHLWLLALLLLPHSAGAAPHYTITDLGTLGGSNSCATGISASGQIVGELRWSMAQSMLLSGMPLKDVGPGPRSTGGSCAAAINDSGYVVGHAQSSGATMAAIWNPEGVRSLLPSGPPAHELASCQCHRHQLQRERRRILIPRRLRECLRLEYSGTYGTSILIVSIGELCGPGK